MVVLKPKYVNKNIKIDKDTIENFYVLTEERRKLKTGAVKSLTKNLLSGQHFDVEIAVNKRDDTELFRVIDGNHRIEAIRNAIENDENFSIMVWCRVYYNLSRQEERAVYSLCNKGSPESATDYLKQYFKTIPLGEDLIRELPVSIYGSENTIKMAQFVGCYFSSLPKKYPGVYSVNGEKLVAGMKSLTNKDIQTMKEWYKFMVETFGPYYNKHPFYRTTPLSVFYRIWNDNRDIPKTKLHKLLKKYVADRLSYWNEMMKNGGRDGSKFFYNQLILFLNNEQKSIHIKKDEEVIRESEAKLKLKNLFSKEKNMEEIELEE